MKLSFVIPAHNEEDYLGLCLDSVGREIKNRRDAEVIVVNNASTDRTREVASRYPWVKIIDERRKGIVWARARGFAESSGELVANIDADAILPDGWLRRALREFECNKNLVCVSGPQEYYELPWYTRLLIFVFYSLGYLFYLVNRFVLHKASLVQGGNFVVKREALHAVGGFDTSIDFYGEDTDLARRLLRVGDVKFTFSLSVLSSARRLVHEGLITMGVRYGMNYLWTAFTGKPYTKTSVDIRRKNKK